jgi:hypothetical protein
MLRAGGEGLSNGSGIGCLKYQSCHNPHDSVSAHINVFIIGLISRHAAYALLPECCQQCSDTKRKEQVMSREEMNVLEAQVSGLDHEIARRVTDLVTQCGASLNLALQAVQDADGAIRKPVYAEQSKVHRMLAAFMSDAKAL